VGRAPRFAGSSAWNPQARNDRKETIVYIGGGVLALILIILLLIWIF
jgi:hypothetical protein